MEKKQYIDIEHTKTLMKENNLNEKALAVLIGLSLPAVKKFLGGADQRHYSSILIIRLGEVFNVSMNSLLHKEYQKN